MDEIHVHKTKKSICAHFAESPCNSSLSNFPATEPDRARQNWKNLEGILSQDMTTLSVYLQTWRFKHSHTKTVMAVFHLYN